MRAPIPTLVVALAIATSACGAAGGSTPVTFSTPSPGASSGPSRDVVRGEVVRIEGRVVTVSEADGADGHFDLLPATVVARERDATATDAGVGTCAFGIGERAAPDLVDASRMIIADHGPKGPDDCRRGSGGGVHHLGVAGGVITAVDGDTYTVSSNAGPQRFRVMSQTRVTRLIRASAADLATGQCVTARGRRDGTGTVAAVNVVITPSAVGRCFVSGGRGGLGGG